MLDPRTRMQRRSYAALSRFSVWRQKTVSRVWEKSQFGLAEDRERSVRLADLANKSHRWRARTDVSTSHQLVQETLERVPTFHLVFRIFCTPSLDTLPIPR